MKSILIAWTLLVCLVATPTLAQQSPPFDHPLFTGPIRESEPLPIDVQHVRIDLTVNPKDHEVLGSIAVEFSLDGSDSLKIALPVDSLTLSSIDIMGVNELSSARIDWVDGDPWMNLNPSVHSATKASFLLRMEISRLDGLGTYPLDTSSGPWESVWSTFEPGRQEWLSFPVDVDDWFTVDLRVSVPENMTVFLPGTRLSTISSGGRKIARSTLAESGPVTQVGFTAALASAVVSTGPDSGSAAVVSGPGPSPDDGSLLRTAESISEIRNFLTDRIRTPVVATEQVLFLPGIGRASSSGYGLSFVPSQLIRSHSTGPEHTVQLARIAAAQWVARYIRPAGWTDIWTQTALIEYLSLLYVRDQYDSVQYLDGLWKLRKEYFSEFDRYQRPLVWDQWNHPLDMIDAHARAKGAWILHMLDVRLGSDNFWSGLNYLADMGRNQRIGTEELRLAMETASQSSLSEYFDLWVYGSGHPVLKFDFSVGPDQDAIDMTFEQTQTGYLVPSSFVFDIDVESRSLVGTDSIRVTVSQQSQVHTMPVELRPQYVRLDPRGSVLFDYADPLDASDLISSLRRSGSDAERYVSLSLLKKTAVDPTLMLGLRPVLDSVDNPFLRAQLMDLLARLAPSSSALRSVLAATTDPGVTVRAAAVAALGSFPGAPQARLAALEAANREQDPDVLAAAVQSLVRLDQDLAWTVLQSAMITPSVDDIVRRTALPLVKSAMAGDDVKIELLFPILAESNLPVTRVAAVRALKDWIENSEVRNAILGTWKLGDTQLRSAVLDCLSEHGVIELLEEPDIETLRDWEASEPLPGLRRRLSNLLTLASL